MKLSKRIFINISFALLLSGCATIAQDNKTLPVELHGNLTQSGAIIGKTLPFADIEFDGIQLKSDKDGNFVLGLDRDAGPKAILTIKSNDRTYTRTFDIIARSYDISEVNGLPPATINPPPEAQAKIAADTTIKQAAWASLNEDARGFLQTFRWPLDNVRITSNWGAVRRLNGTLGRPHYGVDLGAPQGTTIYAPASGKIIIAQSDLFYEGGLVGIDHGQGFITYTMHMSKVDVAAGQIINQGDKLGEVGSTGRSNGPHCHWSLRWHGRQLDPALMVNPLPKLD